MYFTALKTPKKNQDDRNIDQGGEFSENLRSGESQHLDEQGKRRNKRCHPKEPELISTKESLSDEHIPPINRRGFVYRQVYIVNRHVSSAYRQVYIYI